ncbi:MAG: amidohydrolase family protein [Parvularculaceae bacterium]|nr:amidohydrolase family protein [Parvularculaceae bacterium]
MTIYSGAGGAPFVGSIAVSGGVISRVVAGSQRNMMAAQTVDGAGRYLTPGLWDMHAHVRASTDRAPLVEPFLMYGVTSIRDLGGYIEPIKALQAEIALGAPGPTFYSSYTTLNGKAFAPFQRAVTTEAESAAAIDALARAGAVQIKIHRALAPQMLPVVLRQAHERGLSLTGHIPLGVHPLTACELGMDGIEHVGSFIESYVSAVAGAKVDDAVAYMLSDAALPLYKCLASRGVEVTPTLVVYQAVARARAKGGALPEGAADFIRNMGLIALRLHREGVTLLSGADTSDLESLPLAPGASLLDELELLQQAGIPARDIIAIATINAARTLGAEARTGSIEVGRSADFLLLRGDPGEDVRRFRDEAEIYRAGKRVMH